MTNFVLCPNCQFPFEDTGPPHKIVTYFACPECQSETWMTMWQGVDDKKLPFQATPIPMDDPLQKEMERIIREELHIPYKR